MIIRGFIFILISVMLLHTNFAQENRNGIENAIKKSERIINKLIGKESVPGIAITVIKDSAIIWQQGYGYADIAQQIPVNAKTTLFRIASISKPIAATGLARMVADSIIDINASFYRYVPYFPKKKYDFTIKQLGSHTSGIRGYKGKEFINNSPLNIKEGVGLVMNDPLLFKPGTSYLYSSYNWNLIALAMQEVIGVPFEVYIKEKVLMPLQMHRTIADTQDTISNKAVFYTRNRRKGQRIASPVNNYYKLAAGGYLSTSDDIAKLGNAYLQGNFIPEIIASQFLTSQKTGTNRTHYGIGWEVSFDDENRPFYGHVGNGIGAYAFFYIYPAQKMVFSILMNVTNPGVDEELRKVIDYIIDGAFSGEK